MRANVDLSPGETILCEPPLASLHIKHSDFIDRSQFLNPDSQSNGRQSLINMRANLSATKKIAFDALYNKDRHGGIVTLVATNTFTDSEKIDGYDHMALRIYEKISRVNHSCRPNAVVSWNPNDGKAYLRSIRHITRGEEVTILYFVSEDFSLQSRNNRQNALVLEHGFNCACPDCRLTGQALTRNNRARHQALQDRARAKADYPDFTSTNHENLLRTQKLREAESWVRELKTTLDVRDTRLSEALGALAEIHIDLFTVAGNMHGDHCNGCTNNGGRKWHLDQAFDCWKEALVIDVRVYGTDHPEIESDNEKINQIAEELAKI